LDQAEMLRTFNCGIGMIVVVSPADVARVRKHLGKEAKEIGTMVARKRGEPLRYQGTLAGSSR
jgi:phosphoribosylformylglycinamidine cyclo-ligase